MRLISQNGMKDVPYENNLLELELDKEGGYNFREQFKGRIIGCYSSKEKALKVMEMIREQYKQHYYTVNWQGVYDLVYFHMPQDNEVTLD